MAKWRYPLVDVKPSKTSARKQQQVQVPAGKRCGLRAYGFARHPYAQACTVSGELA
jgi:hypothetical protein